MYPGSLPSIFNGSVPGHEKLFNVRKCSMYTGVQFGRFHYISRRDVSEGEMFFSPFRVPISSLSYNLSC